MQPFECIIPINQAILFPRNMLLSLGNAELHKKVLLHHSNNISWRIKGVCFSTIPLHIFFFEITYCDLILALNFSRTLLVALVSNLEKGQILIFCLFSSITAGLYVHAEGQSQAQRFLCFPSNFKQQFYLAREESRWTAASSVLSAFSRVPGPALLGLPAAESIRGGVCKERTSA